VIHVRATSTASKPTADTGAGCCPSTASA